MKEDYQKALKKVTLFFLSNPILFNRQNYWKQKGPGTSDQSLFRLRSKLRTIPLFIIWPSLSKDDVIIKQFLSYSKNYICKFITPIHDLINYSTSICPGKCGKEGKKLQKIEYLESTKSFLDEIKTLFTVFEGLLFELYTSFKIESYNIIL